MTYIKLYLLLFLGIITTIINGSETELIMAIKKHYDIALIEKAINKANETLPQKERISYFNFKDNHGYTSLMYAVQNCNLKLTQLLTEKVNVLDLSSALALSKDILNKSYIIGLNSKEKEDLQQIIYLLELHNQLSFVNLAVSLQIIKKLS